MSVAQKVIQTNFFGFVRLTNEIVPRMAKREVPAGQSRGKLVFIQFHQGCNDIRLDFVATAIHPHPHVKSKLYWTIHSGTMVAVASILGELPTAFQGFYNASKAALRSYCETLRMECSVDTVRVNVNTFQ
jgi:short-subunit dehydrogenase